MLNDAFGWNIKLSDFDGVVERKGYLLILEWKEEGTPIPLGQRIMFENITRLVHPEDNVPACRVLVVWHTKGKPAEVCQYAAYTEGRLSFQPTSASITLVWETCFKWFAQIEPRHTEERDDRRRRFQSKLESMSR